MAMDGLRTNAPLPLPLLLLLLGPAVVMAASAQSTTLFWASGPVAPNETLLVAGAR
eukprot:SAG31_NODE_22650_length_520_cov_2.173397_1_plen_56_part_00